jgi:CopG family transcriptional regulator / antitoxin EndoAI
MKTAFDIHILGVYASDVDKPNHNNPMSKRINIVLPDATVAVLDRVSKKGDRSRFISKAVLHFVETKGKQSLRAQLAAGYRANAERDLLMAAEWFPLEEEAWELSETSRKTKKPAKTKRT